MSTRLAARFAARMTDTAIVYADTGASGAFDVVVHAGLPCLMGHVNQQPAATSGDRAELAAFRELFWAPDYVMPETAQVQVSGVRWNVAAGSLATLPGTGVPVYKRCDLTRAV